MAQSATDEIIDEIHALRMEHAASFAFDIGLIIDDLRASERARTEQGWPLERAKAAAASPSSRAFQRSRLVRIDGGHSGAPEPT